MSATSLSRAAAEIPFVDLQRHHAPLVDQLRSAFDDVLDDGGFVLGREVDAFEAEFADVLRHASLRRGRIRDRRPDLGSGRGGRPAGRRGHRPCPYVHRVRARRPPCRGDAALLRRR